MSEITPSQTVGPFFAYGLTPRTEANDIYDWKETASDNLVTPDATGERIRIDGRVFDGDGLPVVDAMIEIWQADAQGRYASRPRRPGARRTPRSRASAGRHRQGGRLRLRDRQAGRGAGTRRHHAGAAHRWSCVFSRGMLRQLYTRIYFCGRGRRMPTIRSWRWCRRTAATP